MTVRHGQTDLIYFGQKAFMIDRVKSLTVVVLKSFTDKFGNKITEKACVSLYPKLNSYNKIDQILWDFHLATVARRDNRVPHSSSCSGGGEHVQAAS